MLQSEPVRKNFFQVKLFTVDEKNLQCIFTKIELFTSCRFQDIIQFKISSFPSTFVLPFCQYCDREFTFGKLALHLREKQLIYNSDPLFFIFGFDNNTAENTYSVFQTCSNFLKFCLWLVILAKFLRENLNSHILETKDCGKHKLGEVSWSSGNAFVSGAGGLRFKSRAD